MEARRLDHPRQVTDHQIHYQSYYDIGGGRTWSNGFSKRSKTELGLSRGAHGLRHGYAHERFAELQACGLSKQDAKTILSQELGHFRVEIIDTYLR